MKLLILENRYTNHQKFLLLIIALITLCFLVSSLLSFPFDIKGYAVLLPRLFYKNSSLIKERLKNERYTSCSFFCFSHYRND